MDIRYQVSPSGPGTPQDEVVAIPESFGGSSYNIVGVAPVKMGRVYREDGKWTAEVEDADIVRGFSTRHDATLAVMGIYAAIPLTEDGE